MKAHRFRIALAALGAFVFALSLAHPAGAFIRLARQQTTPTLGPVVQAHWNNSQLPLLYVINPTNGDLSTATALFVVQASAETWEAVTTSFFTVNPVQFDLAAGHVTPALNSTDGQNSMFFDVAGTNFAPGGSVIAFVRTVIDLTDGHSLDADMVYNDRDFFSSISSPSLTPPPPGPPAQSSVDLQSVITHEFGHSFSLDHTSIANATMIPFIIGDTRQRTLELDDQAGVSTVYPEASFLTGTGTISGTVVSGFDGSATFGAHVEALVASNPGPAQDPLNSISAISGELTLRNGLGEYTIHGLPPGDYHVRIVPLDGVHTIAADPNVGGPYNGLDINFETEYWNGANEGPNGFTDLALDFVSVTVMPGVNTGGINFQTNTFPGQVEIAQFGQTENIVTFRNAGFRAVRFDISFDCTIAKVTFPTFTFNAQVGLPAIPATFPSVRLCELNAATGMPNLAAPLFQIAPFSGSANGVNEIPINIAVTAPKTLFWCFEFPLAGASFPLDFPFLRMDFVTLEKGVFGNSYRMSSAGVPDVFAATIAGQDVDRNIAVSLTCKLPSPDATPIVPIANLGANRRATKVEFSYAGPTDKRLDGFTMPNNSLDHVDLVRRLPSGLLQVEGSAGAGAAEVALAPASVPAGRTFWFAQTVDKGGHASLLSNTTITGFNEDADEPNGRGNADEAKTLPLPAVNRPETYSPAGDHDFFLINAKPGDVIQASAARTGQDGSNNMDLVMFLLDTNGDVLTFDDDSNGNLNPKISFTVPPPFNNAQSKAPRKFFVQLTDIQGSALVPTGTPQVRTAQTYTLSANVIAAASLAGRFGTLVGEDGFVFKNSGPNPANPQAKLLYVLPRSGGASYGVKLRIYDVSGRLVKKLVDGEQPAGPHVAVWDGTDDSGRGVASGHYFARIDAAQFTEKVGITILK